jgi:protein-L-isoaspartate(D-aspartate) O-methyltransferase
VSQVYSLEIIEKLARDADKRLQSLGYHNIEVRNENGYYGWPEHAPYDGIIVTAAAPRIPQALTDQLRTGARLVIPLGSPYGYQELILITKTANGELESRTIIGVRFVPMTGVYNKPSL